MQELLIAADHGGSELKNHLIAAFSNFNWKDLGTQGATSVDYPNYAKQLCEELKADYQLKSAEEDAKKSERMGVLICGSGQGMCMVANRFPWIRAALCSDENMAILARKHNNANVLCLGGRVTSPKEAEGILREFLKTEFEGGRHSARIQLFPKGGN